jgi:AcrR family transcriptional regulator
MLADGTFHQATVEEVATRAGVARATLYQHFGSRLGLVDALCETFDETPALLALRSAIRNAEPRDAFETAIENTVRFWASQEEILVPLYGAAAVDQAAHDLVERQRTDRRQEFDRLLRRLRHAQLLREDVDEKRALATLLMLTSFETFQELRRNGRLSERDVAGTVKESASALLLAQPSRRDDRQLT